LAIAGLCCGCFDAADDCYRTLTCPPPPDAVDAGPAVDVCTGACVPTPDVLWGNPFLVWRGEQPSAPACPPQAPRKNMEQWYTPPPPPTCGMCSCAPPMGMCTLPVTVTADAFLCGTSPGAGTPFDPPALWDGGCTANDAISANLDCDGGPCVQSITIASPVLTEEGCIASSEAPIKTADDPASWTFMMACDGTATGLCPGHDEVCVPAAPVTPSGQPERPAGTWAHCVFRSGDEGTTECPSGYPSMHRVADSYDDTRGCSPCACGSPSGSTCATLVSFYEDGACSMPLASDTVTSAGPMCLDVPPGSALGSKAATSPIYTAGSCTPSGGAPTGTLTPVGFVIACCVD
jgi:hypothetical protein